MRKNLGFLFLCFVGVQSCATRDFGEGGGAETQSGTGAFRVAVTVQQTGTAVVEGKTMGIGTLSFPDGRSFPARFGQVAQTGGALAGAFVPNPEQVLWNGLVAEFGSDDAVRSWIRGRPNAWNAPGVASNMDPIDKFKLAARCVARFETQSREATTNYNLRTFDVNDIGLFQINIEFHQRTCENTGMTSWRDYLNKDKNARCAARILRQRGDFSVWNAWRQHCQTTNPSWKGVMAADNWLKEVGPALAGTAPERAPVSSDRAPAIIHGQEVTSLANLENQFICQQTGLCNTQPPTGGSQRPAPTTPRAPGGQGQPPPIQNPPVGTNGQSEYATAAEVTPTRSAASRVVMAPVTLTCGGAGTPVSDRLGALYSACAGSTSGNKWFSGGNSGHAWCGGNRSYNVYAVTECSGNTANAVFVCSSQSDAYLPILNGFAANQRLVGPTGGNPDGRSRRCLRFGITPAANVSVGLNR